MEGRLEVLIPWTFDHEGPHSMRLHLPLCQYVSCSTCGPDFSARNTSKQLVKPNPGHRSDTTTNYVAFRRPVQGKTQILTSNPVVLHSQVTDDLLHQVFCVYPIVRCTNLPDRCQLAGEATLPHSPWVSATLHSEPRFQRVQRPERAMRISAIVLDGATNGKSFNGAGELAGRM